MTLREFADAIDLGSTLIGETYMIYLGGGCGCAIGAAIVASGMEAADSWPDNNAIERHCSQFPQVSLQCPDCLCQPAAAYWIVSHIHNKHLWPRLKIAQWLREQADAQDGAQSRQDAPGQAVTIQDAHEVKTELVGQWERKERA